jgi:outer membrane protein OmpA-like peptidoglycan-associated protein
MRITKSTFAAVALIAVGGLGLQGCATTDFVKKEIAGVDSRIQSTQDQVNAQQGKLSDHDARIAATDRTAHDALDRAQAAGKLAEGKFLYSMVLSDDSVKFSASGSDLTPEAQTRLSDFAQKLKTENRNVYLEIQGHTDDRGSKAGNLRLGQDRAEAVRRFLNQQGVALNRISTISYGDSAPVASNKNRAGRAQNRRVVVIVLN